MPFLTRAVARLIEATCILLLLVLTGAVVYSTIFRYLGASPVWYDEMAQVLLAWLTYFAAVHAMFKRQHMGFAGLVLAMPTPLRRVFILLSETAIVLFFGVAVYYGTMILPIASFDSLLSLPWVSMAVIQSVIPITGVLMIFASLSTLPKVMREAMAGIDREHAEIEEAIAATEAELHASSRKGVA